MFIIKKGSSPSSFQLKNKIITLKAEPIINNIDNQDWEEVLTKYGKFVKERIFDEKTNPKGCFIVSDKKEIAKDEGAEVLGDLKDNSSRINVANADDADNSKDSYSINSDNSGSGDDTSTGTIDIVSDEEYERLELLSKAKELGIKAAHLYNVENLKEKINQILKEQSKKND
ncbi:MAG: hypothetical protein LBF97_02125 [Elusimicrobiota bacterium]|jgi:hypothetical protein|nr:hypothetical protein [Elusimicrobiota bacterium]